MSGETLPGECLAGQIYYQPVVTCCRFGQHLNKMLSATTCFLPWKPRRAFLGSAHCHNSSFPEAEGVTGSGCQACITARGCLHAACLRVAPSEGGRCAPGSRNQFSSAWLYRSWVRYSAGQQMKARSLQLWVIIGSIEQFCVFIS